MNAQQAMLRAAQAKTILPAFNIPYLPMMEPVVQAIRDEDAAAMIQVARLEWEKFDSKSLEAVAAEYEKYATEHTFLHLDHVPVIDEDQREVDYLPIILRAVQAGYQSVMIDGSRLPLEGNISATAKVSELAHRSGVAVEAELGAVAGMRRAASGWTTKRCSPRKKGLPTRCRRGCSRRSPGATGSRLRRGAYTARLRMG
jgi:fructose/tagatose bisphosphate aldolase